MKLLIALPGTGKSHLDWRIQLRSEPYKVCEYGQCKYADADFADPLGLVHKGNLSAISFLESVWHSTNDLGFIPMIALPPKTRFAADYFREHFQIRLVAKDYETVTKIKDHWLLQSGITTSKESYLQFVEEQVGSYGEIIWIAENLENFLSKNTLF